MQPALHVERIPADTFVKFWTLVGSRKFSTVKPALRAHEVNSLRLACDPQVVVDKYRELHPDIKLSRASMLSALSHAGISQLQRVECMCELCLTFIQASEDVMSWLDDMTRLGAYLIAQKLLMQPHLPLKLSLLFTEYGTHTFQPSSNRHYNVLFSPHTSSLLHVFLTNKVCFTCSSPI